MVLVTFGRSWYSWYSCGIHVVFIMCEATKITNAIDEFKS